MNEAKGQTIETEAKESKEDEQDIKTMRLYHSGRQAFVFKELKARQKSLDDITVSDVVPFLCMNYTGVEGTVKGITHFNLSSKSRVLDLGSGLGGPALQIVDTIGCEVVGSELQEDVASCARDIARRCKIEKASFVSGDFMQLESKYDNTFDALVSILCILHLPVAARSALFTKIFELLKSDGSVYIEDFFLKTNNGKACEFSEKEQVLLKDEVAVPNALLPTQDEYVKTLTTCGFAEVKFEDVTKEWIEFTKKRLEKWNEDKDRVTRIHGENTWTELKVFYTSVYTLFASGKLGGAKLWFHKK